MYVIFHGEVSVHASDTGSLTCILHENQVFGERALDRDEVRVATVFAFAEHTICLALRKKDYKEILYVNNPFLNPLARTNLAEKQETDLLAVAAFLQALELH
jgi:CRP-like cAMP-binding protein